MVNIGLDDESGGYMMTKYLLECGYEHIKVCAGRDSGVDHLRYLGAQKSGRRTGRWKAKAAVCGTGNELRKAQGAAMPG